MSKFFRATKEGEQDAWGDVKIVISAREKQELLDLLTLFVSRTPVALKLPTTFQTQYVCPLCGGSITNSDLFDISPVDFTEFLHGANCKWYQAARLVSELT